MDKYNLRMNIEHKLGKTVKVGATTQDHSLCTKMSVPRMCYGALLLMRLLVKHTIRR